MISNPNCVICSFESIKFVPPGMKSATDLRDYIDKTLKVHKNAKQCVSLLVKMYSQLVTENDKWLEGYCEKRSREELTDNDIAEKNARSAALDRISIVRNITVEEIEQHYLCHVKFDINQSYKTPNLSSGDIVSGHNLTQINPHTKIGEGLTGLQFIDCNLTNCDLPKDTVVKKSLILHRDFCTHLHQDIPKNPCKKLCSHVVSHLKKVVVEGTVIARDVITYADKDA